MEERAFWLAWSQVTGIGPTLLLRLQRHFGTLAAAWGAHPTDLMAVEGFGLQTAEAVSRARSSLNPTALLQQHEAKNPSFWTPADASYPRLLLEIPDPPPVLYYQGSVEPQENQGIIPSIAIVGTRDPSDYGRRWARRISAALTQTGFTVISGLADGIDTEVHRSCLSAGGRTIAVLGTGVDVVYPWANRNLAQQIVEQGLLLSEYPAGTQPDRGHFPRRNRIIAGLSRATLVLEAPQRSGALITARLANEYGRDVYALPGSLDNPRSKGCLELLNHGAHVILGESHLLELLGEMPRLQVVQSPEADQLTLPKLGQELEQVLQAVTPEPVAVDWIVQQAGLATGSVLSALSQLELMGLVSQLPGMRYQRC
ncbi:DNA-protecting protein DprA [Oculatella sp. LEGE 06141]|uniref:DNA-processing protein DprA n=1 Tax=Oculatella sp. LEGE 06141 TaxID=1828648 RepID=UPI0018813B99|nr:DNA-processing protein DprA [Oculatella sp. LEGE 06141]MBE9177137.1 DNA-protecting protein DprA [Oculatella sp. LEGE 06141]